MKTLYIILFTLLLVSCQVQDITPANKETTPPVADSVSTTTTTSVASTIQSNAKIEYTESKNVAYGSDELQNYDIYIPQNQDTPTPVIILLHGGGWSEGDKGFINPMVDYLKKKNIKCAIVNANYRLTFKAGITYKQQLADIDLIIKNLQRESKNLNITPKIFLTGISAGSHLALLYAYSIDKNNLVKVTGGIVTPTDLTSDSIRVRGMDSDITKLIGKTYSEAPAEYQNASPLFQVKSSSPPTILFSGGMDELVPKRQGEVMKVKLQELNVTHEYYFHPEQSHNWSLLNETLDKMIVFADKFI